MRSNFKKIINPITISLFLALSIVFCLCITYVVPTSAESEERAIGLNKIVVKQHITLNSGFSKPIDSIDYLLESVTKDAPLPEEASSIYEFNLKGDERREIAISYNTPGEYVYKLYQRRDKGKYQGGKNNVTRSKFDDTIYTVKVRVLKNNESLNARTYLITDNRGYKHEDCKFINKYEFPPELNADKIVSNINTGDKNQLISYSIIMILAIFSIVFILWVRKKSKE